MASRAAYLCFAQEPSRLGVAFEVGADLPYQVGYASLERKLGVGGGLADQAGAGPLGHRRYEPGSVPAGSAAALKLQG